MKTYIAIATLIMIASSTYGQLNLDSVKAAVVLEAKPVYIKAYTDVETIKSEVNLAKQNLAKPAVVITHFNQVLGPTMGKETTLSRVEKRINSSGDAYIKMMYIKEQSRIMLIKAAEQKYNADNQ